MSEPEVRLNDDGSLDELVGSGAFHLEQMGDNHWWMSLTGPGGEEVHVWLQARGKITASYERMPPSLRSKIRPLKP